MRNVRGNAKQREVCRSVNQYGRPTSGFLVLVMVVTKGGNGQCTGRFRRILVNHPWHVNVVDRELSNKISHGGKMREERAVCGVWHKWKPVEEGL